jgi:hypothetical protein
VGFDISLAIRGLRLPMRPQRNQHARLHSRFLRLGLAQEDAPHGQRHFFSIHFAIDSLNGSFFDKRMTNHGTPQAVIVSHRIPDRILPCKVCAILIGEPCRFAEHLAVLVGFAHGPGRGLVSVPALAPVLLKLLPQALLSFGSPFQRIQWHFEATSAICANGHGWHGAQPLDDSEIALC